MIAVRVSNNVVLDSFILSADNQVWRITDKSADASADAKKAAELAAAKKLAADEDAKRAAEEWRQLVANEEAAAAKRLAAKEEAKKAEDARKLALADDEAKKATEVKKLADEEATKAEEARKLAADEEAKKDELLPQVPSPLSSPSIASAPKPPLVSKPSPTTQDDTPPPLSSAPPPTSSQTTKDPAAIVNKEIPDLENEKYGATGGIHPGLIVVIGVFVLGIFAGIFLLVKYKRRDAPPGKDAEKGIEGKALGAEAKETWPSTMPAPPSSIAQPPAVITHSPLFTRPSTMLFSPTSSITESGRNQQQSPGLNESQPRSSYAYSHNIVSAPAQEHQPQIVLRRFPAPAPVAPKRNDLERSHPIPPKRNESDHVQHSPASYYYADTVTDSASYVSKPYSNWSG
jgi:chemotaxis protein histidine kinase CheA